MPKRAPLPTPTEAELHHLKSVERCSICSSPERIQIELMALRRSRRVPLEDGTPSTLENLQKVCQDKYGLTLHGTTISRHLLHRTDPHTLVQDAALVPGVKLQTTDRQAALAQWRAEHPEEADRGTDVGLVDSFLKTTVRAGLHLVQAMPHLVTVDQAVASSRILMQHQEAESQALLMAELVDATGSALRRIAQPAQPVERVAQSEREVIEVVAEIVEEEPEDAA